MSWKKHFLFDTSNQWGHKFETDKQLQKITTYRSRKLYMKQYLVYHVGFQPKIARHIKRPKIQFEETEQASEPDLDMEGMLEL